MDKIDELQDLEYEEIQEQFAGSDNLKCMIRAMLSLERLWQPFLYSSSHIGTDAQKKIREYMDGVWERIFAGQVNSKKEEYYWQLIEDVGERLCEAEDNGRLTKCRYEGYLYDALVSGFGWFFMPDKSKKIGIVLAATDLISDQIVDEYIAQGGGQEEGDYYMNHPYRKAEFERIEKDRVISELYPESKNEIIKLREQYQNMWIIPKGNYRT